jgi:hypothetical protein
VNEAIGQSLPFAVGVGLSPIPIIAVVLMLATPRARVNGPAFLAGWVLLGVKQWRGRPRGDEEAALPKWMATVDHFGPAKAFGFGAVLSGANPKNLLLTVGAAAAIGQTGSRPVRRRSRWPCSSLSGRSASAGRSSSTSSSASARRSCSTG